PGLPRTRRIRNVARLRERHGARPCEQRECHPTLVSFHPMLPGSVTVQVRSRYESQFRCHARRPLCHRAYGGRVVGKCDRPGSIFVESDRVRPAAGLCAVTRRKGARQLSALAIPWCELKRPGASNRIDVHNERLLETADLASESCTGGISIGPIRLRSLRIEVQRRPADAALAARLESDAGGLVLLFRPDIGVLRVGL